MIAKDGVVRTEQKTVTRIGGMALSRTELSYMECMWSVYPRAPIEVTRIDCLVVYSDQYSVCKGSTLAHEDACTSLHCARLYCAGLFNLE
jgi:hypothetical protein